MSRLLNRIVNSKRGLRKRASIRKKVTKNVRNGRSLYRKAAGDFSVTDLILEDYQIFWEPNGKASIVLDLDGNYIQELFNEKVKGLFDISDSTANKVVKDLAGHYNIFKGYEFEYTPDESQEKKFAVGNIQLVLPISTKDEIAQGMYEDLSDADADCANSFSNASDLYKTVKNGYSGNNGKRAKEVLTDLGSGTVEIDEEGNKDYTIIFRDFDDVVKGLVSQGDSANDFFNSFDQSAAAKEAAKNVDAELKDIANHMGKYNLRSFIEDPSWYDDVLIENGLNLEYECGKQLEAVLKSSNPTAYKTYTSLKNDNGFKSALKESQYFNDFCEEVLGAFYNYAEKALYIEENGAY